MRKIEKRLYNLEQSNSGLFLKNESLKKEFDSIRFDVVRLEATNAKLKEEKSRLTYEKEEYEVSLRREIERIQLLGTWKRFWGSVELFKNLFEVIQSGFKE